MQLSEFTSIRNYLEILPSQFMYFFPPFPVHKMCWYRDLLFFFFEYTVLLAQSMKDQLTVNSCHRWYAILMADIVKLLVIYIFSRDSGVLHF